MISQAKKILRDRNIPLTDNRFLKLRTLLSNNLGYMGLFTKFSIIDKISDDRIERLYGKITKNKDLLCGLSKPIIEYSNFEKLDDDISKLEEKSMVKSLIDSFPSKQKSLIFNYKERVTISNDGWLTGPSFFIGGEMINYNTPRFINTYQISDYSYNEKLYQYLIDSGQTTDSINNRIAQIQHNISGYQTYTECLLQLAREIQDFRNGRNLNPPTIEPNKNSIKIGENYIELSIYNKLLNFAKNVHKEKIDIFLRKISSYSNMNQLLENMESFMELESSFEETLDKIQKTNSIITYKNEETGIIICRVFDFEACKELGKKSSWCIAREDSYFKEYTSGGKKQYIIFDTKTNQDNRKKIGITFNRGNIMTHCHDIYDFGFTYEVKIYYRFLFRYDSKRANSEYINYNIMSDSKITKFKQWFINTKFIRALDWVIFNW